MPNFLQALRLKNLFHPPDMATQSSGLPMPHIPIGNDLPSQGGITGNLPRMTPSFPSSNPELNPNNMPSVRQPTLSPMDSESEKRFTDLLGQYPTHEKPGLLRRIAAGLSTYKYGPEVGHQIMDQPFNEKLTDWKNRIGPSYQAAQLERQGNVAESTTRHQAEADRLRQEALDAKSKNDEIGAKIKQQRADVYEFKANNPDLKLVIGKGGNMMAFDPKTGKMADTGIDSGSLSDADKLALTHDLKMEEIGATGEEARKTEGTKQTGRESLAEKKGWTIFNVPDGLGGQKAVRMNTDTGVTEDLSTGPVQKPGTPSAGGGITTQTRTMMEGAQMMLPHINDLSQQAQQLDRDGLFGPAMSRIRNLAAKIGTTGSPDDIQHSFEKYGDAIMNDPLLSKDARVGQFALNLGLMASGVGRVHGGARGGGSTQMVNYMKALLSADSTLPMFMGRLNTLQNYMKGYAAGPVPAAGPSGKLNQAIDDILKGAK